MREAGYLPKLLLSNSGKLKFQTHKGNKMIYSFLDEEVAEKLNITADVTFSKHKKENVFRFKIEGSKLTVTDTSFYFSGHAYENVNIINELKVGDQIIAEAMDGSTVVKLADLGVKVSLHTDNKLVSI